MDGRNELIQQARSGERQAFEVLIQPLIEPGYNLAFTMLGHRQDAEDVIQEAVLKAWRNLWQLRDGKSIKAWFLQIVANESRMTRRGRWRSVIKVPELTSSREEHAERGEEQMAEVADLRRAVDGLQAPDRLIVYLYYGLDLTLEEVADVLGLSVGAARSRLYRAVGRLKPALDGEAP